MHKEYPGSARRLAVALLALSSLVLAGATAGSGSVGGTELTRYTVVLKGTATEDGFALTGVPQAALDLVRAAGGTVTADMSRQIGVLGVESTNGLFLDLVRASPLVEVAAQEFVWKAFPSYEEAVESGQLTVTSLDAPPGGGPEPSADPGEALQWDMAMIRTEQAHAVQSGSRAVEVGIVDSGIHAAHPDFVDTDGLNVDCIVKGRDFVPLGPTVSLGTTCNDNQFHGTHVAGIVAARANGIGIVGVAPNVTLVPIKVCDPAGYCYSNSTAAGITYSGDAHLEVINMSFFVDDNALLESHEFKCRTDPVQNAFRKANERAIQYARNKGVVPVAALGNSNNDLSDPPEPYENECEVVPAETPGVVGTMALGPTSEKASYSSYGVGATDVAAPGGNSGNPHGEIPGPCGTQVVSTIPGGYGCFQGTSMASPHAAGVAALIVSHWGRVGNDAGTPDVVMRPQDVESDLQATAIDLVGVTNRKLQGYDGCFGHGRVDALRAVRRETRDQDWPVAAGDIGYSPFGCPTYE